MDVYPDRESLSQAAAQLWVRQAAEAVQTRGRFSVALSGGSTPGRTYELLAQPPFTDQVPWDRTHIFWGDERCVPLDDSRSNARVAHQTFLDRVPIPESQVHPIFCHQSPEAGAAAYEAELRAFGAGAPPRLDLIFLGLGEDGHTASLFPGSAALEEKVRWAVPVYVPAQGFHRVTLTAPFINQAALVVFLVAGANKAMVLKEVLTGPRDPKRLPAQLISPRDGELHWLVDREAASQLA
jgi:6-phosphogluconolactonase